MQIIKAAFSLGLTLCRKCAPNICIDLKYHYVRECIAVKKIVLYHIPTEDNTADIFTKNLGCLKFEKFKQQLGIEFLP
jgi:hypothetical protein